MRAPHTPQAMLIFSFFIVVFGYGYEASYRGWFPRSAIISAHSFYSTLEFRLFGYKTFGIVTAGEIASTDVERKRIKVIVPGHNAEKILISGGAGQFLEYCPNFGCLAVVLTRQGKLVLGVPFLPDEFKKKPLFDAGRDSLLRHIEKDIQTVGVLPLLGGDFIFNIVDLSVVPYGGGLARVHPNGRIVWYRRDYTHHWSGLDLDGNILSTSRSVVGADWPATSGLNGKQFQCRGDVLPSDTLEVVDVHGQYLRSFSVIKALSESRFRPVLSEIYNLCDVTHINFVRQIGPALAARWIGVSVRDYLVSIRHLSAFIVMDANDGHVKKLVRGTFVRQHSVQPLPDGRIVMFDNEGMGDGARPSRVLILDPADWSERTLFPTAQTPKSMDTYSVTGSYIDVSRDGKRLWVSIEAKGVSYEIEIATGKVLTIYNNYHPTAGRDGKLRQVRRMMVSQVQYFY